MLYPDVIYSTFSAKEVPINQAEAARRLQTSRDYTHPSIERCRQRLEETVRYRFGFVRVPVSFPEEGVCDLGFYKIYSKNLARNLSGCNEVYLMAVTTGIGVDRLLARLSAASKAEYFITDALSSAAAESACDALNNLLKKEVVCKPRFSPGFGDLALSVQKPILERLNAPEKLGITLNSALLMTPMKSVTAIMGVLA